MVSRIAVGWCGVDMANLSSSSSYAFVSTMIYQERLTCTRVGHVGYFCCIESGGVFASVAFPSCLSPIDADQVDYQQQPVMATVKKCLRKTARLPLFTLMANIQDISRRYWCWLRLQSATYPEICGLFLLTTSMLGRFMPALYPLHASCHPNVAEPLYPWYSSNYSLIFLRNRLLNMSDGAEFFLRSQRYLTIATSHGAQQRGSCLRSWSHPLLEALLQWWRSVNSCHQLLYH